MNEQLRGVLLDAGFLDRDGTVGRKRFARAVTEAAASRGLERVFTHTYVSRWLAGTVPRDEETRACVLQALGRQLGRAVHPDEVGFALGGGLSPDVGLALPRSSDEATAAVATLLQADADDSSVLVDSAVSPTAWTDASLTWLVGARRPHDEVRRSVDIADVARLRQTHVRFGSLDNAFGGGHARQALVTYLRHDLPKLLRANASDAVRTQLFAAAAEITQLAAWSSYDSGRHGLAQRYFIQALGLADVSGDRALAAGVLDAMSHQATYLGRLHEATNLARAARLGTDELASPILSAHFHLMEARALARAGDAAACDAAMSAAVSAFDRHAVGDGPEWIQYFDEAEFAAELAHCHRDLGRPAEAIEWATAAVDAASGDYARSDFFVTMVLAHAQLDAGHPEAGAETALRALEFGETLHSARGAQYVRELRERLPRFRGSRALAGFADQARHGRLWQEISTGTSRAGKPPSGWPQSAWPPRVRSVPRSRPGY
ncbi:XRE family transcriptional regulator [Pseudonocardia ailaonensis]|uniref:XRE family transcriptional regulator n=1 Tax=Pseudonocardia ailaonensis TaxID=367279 RepID=A0ABN2N9Q4_9PSEU